MKYIQFAIMAVLMFSLAISPAFSNGLAFATTEDGETRGSTAEHVESDTESDKAGQRGQSSDEGSYEREQKESDKDGQRGQSQDEESYEREQKESEQRQG